MTYGVEIDWKSGTRSSTQRISMIVGPHRVSRSFVWKSDEPRQLMGNNHGPNPQELLLSGLGSCMMVSFVARATAEGIQLETVRIDSEGVLELRGFMGLGTNSTIGFPTLRYKIHVTGDATAEQFEALHKKSVSHIPNAQTMIHPVNLDGKIVNTQIDM